MKYNSSCDILVNYAALHGDADGLLTHRVHEEVRRAPGFHRKSCCNVLFIFQNGHLTLDFQFETSHHGCSWHLISFLDLVSGIGEVVTLHKEVEHLDRFVGEAEVQQCVALQIHIIGNIKSAYAREVGTEHQLWDDSQIGGY